MNHDPYEEWLLTDEVLTEEQQQELNAHLESCEECTQIASAWQAVENKLISAAMAAPAPGFTQRWQVHLAEQRHRQHTRLSWTLLLVCAGGALITFLAIYLSGLQEFPTPITLLSALLHSAAVITSTIQDAQIFIQAFLNTVPLGISILLWIFVSTSLCIWILIWMISIWRIPLLNRSQNEIRN